MIEVKGLIKDYGSFRAVDRLSFDVAQGEIVGFLGPNGAGKTTTIRVLTGYQPANSGTVRILGADVQRDSLRVRAGLGYLPENVPIYPDLRVEEYLRFRAALKGVARKERRARVAEAMDQAGVTEMRRKLVGAVSRGYRQRVGLADALVGRPPLLILDEPTSGLDPNQRRRVRERILELRGDHTILFSSHILSDVEAICDRVILIHEGKKAADGSLASLRKSLGESRLEIEVRGAAPELGELVFAGLPLVGKAQSFDAGGGFTAWSGSLDGTRAWDELEILELCGQRCAAKGLELRRLHMHRPSLEEIFQTLTEGAGFGGSGPLPENEDSRKNAESGGDAPADEDSSERQGAEAS